MSAQQDAKKALVQEIKTKIQNASSIVLVDYKGITVAEDTVLRSEMRKNQVEYKVLKNRLLKIAFNELGFTQFDNDLNGTTAVAFAMGDAVAPAKVLLDANKKINKLTIKSGMIGTTPVDADGIVALSKLPSKEVLVAQVLGMLNAPIRGFATVLNETIAGLARCLQAIAEK